MTRYRVWLFCHDCTGVDYQGCFGGGSEERFLDADGNSDSEDHGIPIESLEVAEKIGWQSVRDCGPWHFEVEEVNDA